MQRNVILKLNELNKYFDGILFKRDKNTINEHLTQVVTFTGKLDETE